MTSLQVKQVIWALHPQAIENPASFKAIKKALDLQSHLLEKGYMSKTIHTFGSLWIAGERTVDSFINDMVNVMYVADSDTRLYN